MKDIVSTVRVRAARCEIYPCRQKAKYGIGLRKQICLNVCEEHMRMIMERGAELLGYALLPAEEMETNVVTDSIVSITDENTGNSEPSESENEDNAIDQLFGNDETYKEELPKQPDIEVYRCKYCGATFPKTPKGKTELMTHCKNCPDKPKKV